MKVKKGPTLRAQWLGKRLREYREAANLTLKDAGDYIQRDAAAVSRLENGITPGRVPDVLMLLNLYGIGDPHVRDGMERLSRDIWQKGWWDDYAGETTSTVIDLPWLESRANGIRSYDAVVLHGLLQTRAYAEAVMKAHRPTAAPTYFTRWLEFRATRQHVLTDQEPLHMNVVIDEAVVRRTVGGAQVMRDQLLHLAELTERPNIAIRILPFSAGAHASPSGFFAIFDMPSPYSDVAYVETEAGAIYMEAEGVDRFAETYDYLQTTALPPDESRIFIEAIVRQII
jgi:transcriptional regulator with XRE-family HTH domain